MHRVARILKPSHPFGHGCVRAVDHHKITLKIDRGDELFVFLIPGAFLAAMKAAETGQNYWVVLGMVVAVFCIVQLIIESIVIPKIMGKKMGLNPAVLLLSLSIWGALLGFIGLIIALPATTIIIAYWKKYVTKESEESAEATTAVAETQNQ